MKVFSLGGSHYTSIRVFVSASCLLLSVMASAYSFKLEQSKGEEAFRFLARDAFGALEAKMARYSDVLDSGAALFAAMDEVKLQDWATFTETLHVELSVPGMLGLGYIVPVDRDATDSFLAEVTRDGVQHLNIHPKETEGPLYVIKYIEPLADNRQAVGLNIAFEQGRRNAANLSRDTGTLRLTQRIELVQDDTRKPGFLLLRPHYRKDALLRTVQERRNAHLGWVYMPFIGAKTLESLTINQDVNFTIAAYEGDVPTQENLIYQSEAPVSHDPQFTHIESVDVFGQPWSIKWESTPEFEAARSNIGPFLILFSGFVLTSLMFGFIKISLRRERVISDRVALKTHALKSLQDETRAIWENAVVPILVLNDEGQVINDNPAARHLMGPPGSARYKEIANCLSRRVEIDSSTSASGLAAVVLDDDYLLLEVQRNRWTAPNGDGRTTMIVQNVTEEREAAQRVAETEQRWDLALRGAKIGVFDVNLRSQTSVVSQTWRNLLHLSKDYIGDTQEYFLSRVHPEDLPKLQANDAACIRGDTDRSVTEFRIKIDDGDWSWMRSDAVVVERDEGGDALRMIGAQTDITDIRRARAALEASHKRFRLQLENAPVGMAILNEGGLIVGTNSALSDFVGFSQAELQNTYNFGELVSYEDRIRIIKAIGGKSATRSQTYQDEHLIRHKDGTEKWGLLSISWGHDPIVERDIYIAQIQDITEKKTVEQLKNSFIATISHELRTPLTSIKGALGLVQANLESENTKTRDRLINIAYKNTDRLIELVNDILDFEQLMAGNLEFSQTECDLQAAIREAVQLIAPLAETHGAKINLDLPDAPIYIEADPVRLAQVLANLLSNACKFSADEGIVQLKAELLDGKAVVYVMDNGDGIPTSFRSDIFQPFSQVDGSDTRMKGGTGLGLSITRELVERMGGSIGFESPGTGLTVFWFCIPTSPRTAIAPRLPIADVQESNLIKVLHIQDDPYFANVIMSGFDGRVDATLAKNLNEARDFLKSNRYDVIVADWSLPDGNRSELLDDFERYQPQAAVLGLSAGNAREPDKRVCQELVKSEKDLKRIVETINQYAQSA